jgi:hypothetical protein
MQTGTETPQGWRNPAEKEGLLGLPPVAEGPLGCDSPPFLFVPTWSSHLLQDNVRGRGERQQLNSCAPLGGGTKRAALGAPGGPQQKSRREAALSTGACHRTAFSRLRHQYSIDQAGLWIRGCFGPNRGRQGGQR